MQRGLRGAARRIRPPGAGSVRLWARAVVSSVLAGSLVVAAPLASAAAPPTSSGSTAGSTMASTAGGRARWTEDLAAREREIDKARSGSATAILPLLGLLGELEGNVDHKALLRFVERVRDDRKVHPEVRAYAMVVRGHLLEAMEGAPAAAKAFAEAGHLLDWQILGPFDNGGRKGEQAVYPPETEPFALEQSFFGKLPDEPLQWQVRRYEDIPRGPYVSLDDRLRPREEVTGYATSWVFVPEPTQAAIHIGSGGPYKVFVDGTVVGEGSGYRAPHPLQDAHPIALAGGWNRILVKVSALSGAWGFYARVSAPKGGPLPGLKASAEPPPGAGKGERPSSPGKVVSLRADLEKAAPRASGPLRGSGAQAARALTDFYRYVHPFDRDDNTAVDLARRVDTAVQTSETAWVRAVLEPEQGGTAQALRVGIERARKEGARARPRLVQMLLELAWLQRSLGLDARYRELLDEAAKVAPDDPVVALATIDSIAEDGFVWLALRRIEQLAERYREAPAVQVELAGRLRERGRSKDALKVLDAAGANRGGEGLALGQRIEILLELGEAEQAAELARRAAASTPGLPQAHAALARLEEARGDTSAAREAMARAVALSPQDAELHAEFGMLLARSGAKTAAVRSLERSLELMPQQPDVRDLLAALSDKSDSGLWKRWGVDLSKVAQAPTPKGWAGKEAGILHHRVAVKVLPNGLTERLDHRIIRVLDDRGIRSQAVQAISFDPAETTVEVRRARVRRKDGTIEELGETRMMALASAGYRMYYDQRQLQVVFPGLRVGDTVEVAFLERDVAARNMFDEYFGDLMPIQGIEPRKHVEYILEAPANKPIYFNLPVDKELVANGRTALYRYEAEAVAGIKPEPGMPGFTEFAKYLHASTYRTWEDVGNWYWGLVEEQLVADDDIKAAVKDVLAKLPAGADERRKVYALYEYVVRNTRYVGLEFGIHGYKPYRTTDVFDRRFGDCKDKASLLKVMLAEAGIPSHLVLVRTRDQGTVEDKPASLAVFNHAITYVPSLDLWLDGTAEWSGPEELPSNDQGASVLVVADGKGAKFQRIPVSKPGDNVRATEQRVTLSADGSAVVEHALEVTGSDAAGMRFRFQADEQRRERLASAFGDMFGGVKVKDVSAPGIGDILRPARVEARLEVPTWATRRDDNLRFRVLGRPSDLASSFAPLAKREHELVLDVPMVERHRLQVQLPRGHRFAQVPAPAKIETAVGRFELSVSQTDEGAEVRSEIEIRSQRISPRDYPAFREFLRKVDQNLEQQFEIVPAR